MSAKTGDNRFVVSTEAKCHVIWQMSISISQDYTACISKGGFQLEAVPSFQTVVLTYQIIRRNNPCR